MIADYLRVQARTCLTWARECFDLAAATRLRLMAEEFMAKADEIEAGHEDDVGFDFYRTAAGADALKARGDDP